MAYLAPGAPASALASASPEEFLADVAGRKEFSTWGPERPAPPLAGYGAGDPPLFLPGLRLHGAQQFIRNFGGPDTECTRLLVKWQTGTGKSIAAASIGHEFSRQFRLRALAGALPPAIHVISFTARETIQEDLLRFPEFGFASLAEAAELRRRRAAAAAAGAASPEARQLAVLVGTLRRRTTDRARGGYYQFYGYKEFAGRLLAVTRQGAERKFEVQSLYGRAEGSFGDLLTAAVRRGDLTVNTRLLDSLRGGLLIADEIHNVYNTLEENNYGLAIQYALDTLGEDAPRAVFMTATPMTGSAAEVVDLLNLLVPRHTLPGGAPLRRADFFGEKEGGAQLRAGALERIGRLAAGRVSFLLDADLVSYPRRLFEGEGAPGVPYLRLTLCPMSALHEQALDAAGRGEASGLAADAHTLYDMVFPGPAGPGLYRSGETPALIAAAPEKWRAQVGITVTRDIEMPDTDLISGAFLGAERLGLYSGKYSRLVGEILAAVRGGPGKVMVYHHRVRMSGVLLIQEALRANGFVDEVSAPVDTTLCAVCGTPRRAHGAAQGAAQGAAHNYAPARFVVAHGGVDRATMLRSIALYNSAANSAGHLYRVLVGSKIVREGLNFRAVRRLLVASLPTDYPTLLQVFGRVVRKDSHLDLPEGQRDVRIRVLVSTHGDGRPSPELRRYAEKGREFLVIQEVERALHAGAVDAVANASHIARALGGPSASAAPSLDALPFAPVQKLHDGPLRTATFEAYGHGDREVALIAAVCRVLFRARPVWTYADLWAAVRAGAVQGAHYRADLFDEDNFALALEGLARPAGDPPAAVVRAGDFFVAAAAPSGPELDAECYLREPPWAAAAAAGGVSVPLAAYLGEALRADAAFAVHLRAFDEAYLPPGEGKRPLELSLLEYGASFHYALLRRLVAAPGAAAPGAAAPGAVTRDDTLVRALYRRYRIAVTAAEAAAAATRPLLSGEDPGALVGYVTPASVVLRAAPGPGPAWAEAPLADFGIGQRHRENDIVVGFTVSTGGASAGAKFKLRLPLQRLRRGPVPDARSLERGGVCETRPRAELITHARRLRAAAAAAPFAATPFAARAARHDRAAARRFPSAGELCTAVRHHLLALEEEARASGMAASLRWVYLFNDSPPTISTAAAPAEAAPAEAAPAEAP